MSKLENIGDDAANPSRLSSRGVKELNRVHKVFSVSRKTKTTAKRYL